MTTEPVVIYSTPTCHFCGMAKEFFKANNIQYTEHDVAADIAERKNMIEKSGQMGVPVITVGDKLVVGFDEEELRSLLGL
jgi:glutaredoxin 3